MRHPIPSRISLGFGFTIRVHQLSTDDYAKVYNASCIDKNPDSSYAFSVHEMDDYGRNQMNIYLKKNMKYADKVRWFTHEVGHHYVDWLDQVRLIAERS